MGELTSGQLLDTAFSGLSAGEVKNLTARTAAYFAEFNSINSSGGCALDPAPCSIDPLPYILGRDDQRLLAQAAGEWGDLLQAGFAQLRSDFPGSSAPNFTDPASGALDPAALWRDARFDPALNNLLRQGRSAISMLGLNVVKDQNAGWQLASLVCGPPRGLGYALETRIIHGRVFSNLLNRSRVLRLAPFFRQLKQQWYADALHHLDEPAVMLWTPGPSDPDYAEHVYLCRYLGYPLVESRDLTVRSGKVYLKMLAGLRPVDVLVRMVGDDRIDPLAGNPAAVDGVAGLVQAVRDGEVFITNMPGSDILEHASVLETLSLNARELTGRIPVVPLHSRKDNPACEPFWTENSWVAKPYMLSLFAAKTAQGWELMPGGVARQLLADHPSLEPAPQGPWKDVWNLSSSTVPFTTLLPQRERPSSISRSADLPSRIADDLFWLGRYAERAWVDLRFLGKWLDITSDEGDELNQKHVRIMEHCISTLKIKHAVTEPGRPGSDWRLWDTLRDMEQIASRVRERFSLETHRIIGNLASLAQRSRGPNPSLRDLVDQASLYLSAFQGFTNEHMTRGSGWRFLDMGKRLERSGLLVEALSTFCALQPDADDLALLLELFDSSITYRSRYYFAPELGPLLDLLILDESNPRSLAFQVMQLQGHLEKLPHNQNAAYRNAGERSVLKLMTSIRLVDGPELARPGKGRRSSPLDMFLNAADAELEVIAVSINHSYLVKLEAQQRLQALNSAEPV